MQYIFMEKIYFSSANALNLVTNMSESGLHPLDIGGGEGRKNQFGPNWLFLPIKYLNTLKKLK